MYFVDQFLSDIHNFLYNSCFMFLHGNLTEGLLKQDVL